MSKRKKALFIVNPVSGYNKNEDINALLLKHLDSQKFDFDYVETEYKGHATELSSQAVKEGYEVVIACGGDGTVNEVAKPLVHTDVSFGILPNGSGNGFAMHIGMGRNTEKAIHKLNKSVINKIDTCTVNEEFFLNLAGIGFDALIAYKVENGKKRGLQMYVNTISKEMLKFKAEKYVVKTDNETIEGVYTLIAVANSAMYGYNFTIAPNAELMDGLLDVVFIKNASLARTFLNSWRMLNNSLDKSRLVNIIKSKEVVVSMNKPYYYHVDGESFEFENELHFKVVPLSLNLHFPPESRVLN